jgi:hypothetical protein
MEFAIVMGIIIVASIIIKIKDYIERELSIRKYSPEHLRDRKKHLQVGQRWTNGTWSYEVQAFNAEWVDYIFDWPEKGFHSKYHETRTKFRDLINSERLYIVPIIPRPTLYGPMPKEK